MSLNRYDEEETWKNISRLDSIEDFLKTEQELKDTLPNPYVKTTQKRKDSNEDGSLDTEESD